MKAKDIYDSAMLQLGYSDNAKLQNRALPIINRIYYELFIIFHKAGEKFTPATTLASEIKLSNEVALSIVMPLGVAAGLAVGEGDGELQQYFAAEYDRARKRFTQIGVVEVQDVTE